VNVNKADVALTALDASDVAPVEFAGQSEILLRKAHLSARFTNALAELCLDRLLVFSDHRIIEAPPMTLSPRTLSPLAIRDRRHYPHPVLWRTMGPRAQRGNEAQKWPVRRTRGINDLHGYCGMCRVRLASPKPWAGGWPSGGSRCFWRRLLPGLRWRSWTVAAGLPLYIALFGRDTLSASWQASILGPEMMTGTLVELARWQGTQTNDWRDEAPGRMLHEAHTGPIPSLCYDPRGRYYGSATTSSFYPFAVSQLWHWTGDKDRQRIDKTGWRAGSSWNSDLLIRVRSQGEENDLDLRSLHRPCCDVDLEESGIYFGRD
jgi:hypothetical protein